MRAMSSHKNNAGNNGASGSKRQQIGHKGNDEEFTYYLREYMVLSEPFHATMSFKDFYTIKHPEWYEPQLSGNKKGKVHIVEVHYDSEDEEVHENATIDAYLEQSDEASDYYASEGQLDGHDNSACSSSSLPGSVETSTLQHSEDTCEDSYVLASGRDEIRWLDDQPLGIDMASRKSCMENDKLFMMTVTHSLSSQTPMIATTHEDISGIPDMVEDPCVRIGH